MSDLIVEQAGPAISVQDSGRPGLLGLGISPGGAADQRSYLEGLALMELTPGAAVIEIAGFGGRFRFGRTMRFALTGAPMRARLNGETLSWGGTHVAAAGDHLEIGAVEQGNYGYLTLSGGLNTPEELGGRGYHRMSGLGQPLADGDALAVFPEQREAVPLMLEPVAEARRPVRLMPGPQTGQFSSDVIAAFEATEFRRSPKANRQGVRLDHDGAPFSTSGQLNLVSDFIAVGDVQMTGDGTPYVLLADCQTIGGYPRIGTVLPVDLPRIAQAEAGETIQFQFVTVDEAERLWESDEAVLANLSKRISPRIRDPREMNLLDYELIGKPLGD